MVLYTYQLHDIITGREVTVNFPTPLSLPKYVPPPARTSFLEKKIKKIGKLPSHYSQVFLNEHTT